MNTDESESNTLNENIVYFRVDEDIVNEQRAFSNGKCGYNTGITTTRTGRRDQLNKVSGLGESDVKETLTIRNRN